MHDDAAKLVGIGFLRTIFLVAIDLRRNLKQMEDQVDLKNQGNSRSFEREQEGNKRFCRLVIIYEFTLTFGVCIEKGLGRSLRARAHRTR